MKREKHPSDSLTRQMPLEEKIQGVERPAAGGTLYLVDGNSLLYRAYYAIPSLSNSRGEPTNAIFGFITMIRKLIDEKKPEYFAVCFDRREPTFRHLKYEAYKAHRKPMPEDLVEQVEPIKDFCRVYRLAVFEKAGYEADDLLGTLALKGAAEGLEVFIVTGDKDAMQLVSEKIRVFNPHKDGQVLGSDEVRKRWDGLGPEKVTDIMALMGDASDNIPGVPGIGEKTAIKLIHEFGSVENVLAEVSKIRSKSQQKLIKENADLARLSKELAVIDTEVPLDISWDEIKLRPAEGMKMVDFFRRYEFKNLIKEFAPTGEGASEQREYVLIRDEKAFDEFVREIKKAALFSFDTETTASDPMRAELVGMSFSWKPLSAYYVPVSSANHGGEGLPFEKVLEALRPVLENEEQKKIGQNIKYDWIVMKRNGVDVRGIYFDTMLASYLVNPLKRNHNLDDISLEYLGIRKIATGSLIGSGKNQVTMDQVPVERVGEYAAEDADCVFRLYPILEKKLEETEGKTLLRDVEMPLERVLAKMEMNGVSLDLEFLAGLSREAEKDLEKLTKEIYREAGREFNINSPKQLAEVLFEDLKLPPVKKTKTGISTDVSVLEKLAESHPVAEKLLEYREKTKLKSTYLDALPEMVHPETHLIHTSYHQTTTVTGRLSSSDPNLQNIPIKTEAGRLIRKAFTARKNGNERRQILSADYSQIELRILAHLTGDPNLTKAFQEDRDVHKVTATLLYGVQEPEVTREMRNAAKTINFSIIYGKTAYGLSQDLKISVPAADQFIRDYFDRYRAVKDYLEAQKERARQKGFLETILGRRSYFPDIHSKNVQARQFAERAAINAPIQGSAADMIKLAMITIQTRLEERGLKSLMIMQVHDELVFDMPEKESSELSALVKKEMEGAYRLRVPLRVDMFTGDSWYKN